MAKIEVFNQDIGVPQLDPRALRGPDLGNAFAPGLQTIAQEADRAELEADEIEVVKKTAELQRKYVERIGRASETDGDNAEGFTARVGQEFKADVDATLKGARSDRARKAMEQRLAGLGTQLVGQAVGFEVPAVRQAKIAGLEETLGIMANTSRLKPDAAPLQIAEFTALVDGMSLPEKDKIRLMRNGSSAILDGAIQAGIDRDPAAARKALQSGVYLGIDVTKLAPGLLDRSLAQADQEIRRRDAEAKAAQREARATAQLNLSFALEDARDVQGRGGLVDAAPIERLMLNAGVKPDQVTRTLQNLQAGNRAAITGREFAGMSFADMQAETQKRVAAVSAGGRGPLYTADPNAAGLLSPGNIDINNRPAVKNADGSVSSVRSVSMNIDGKEVLLPTVSEDGRIMSDAEAAAQFKKTGRHLGMFDTPANATAYAEALHQQQARLGGKGNANAANIEAAAAEQALARHQQLFKQDPAAYVLQLPSVRQQMEAADTPEKMARALQFAMTEQRRIAGPAFDGEIFTPQPLPKLQAAAEAAALTKAAPEDKEIVFAQLQQKYGSAFGPVFAQLQRQEKVDPAFMLMATTRSEQGRVALGTALGQDMKKLRDAVGGDKAKEIDGAIDEALAPLSASLAAAPNRDQIDAQYRDGIKRLAYHYAATMNASEAVKRARKDVLDDIYDFVQTTGIGDRSTGSANLRVKIAPDSGARRGDLALSIADAALRGLKPEQLAAVAEGGTPLTVEQRKEIAWDNARRGVWVNTPDDNGMMLLDVARKPVRLANGEPLVVPWSALPDGVQRFNLLRMDGGKPIYQTGGRVSDKPVQWIWNAQSLRMEQLK